MDTGQNVPQSNVSVADGNAIDTTREEERTKDFCTPESKGARTGDAGTADASSGETYLPTKRSTTGTTSGRGSSTDTRRQARPSSAAKQRRRAKPRPRKPTS